MSGTPKEALEYFLKILRNNHLEINKINIYFEIQNNLYGKDYFKLTLRILNKEKNQYFLQEFRTQIPCPYNSTIYTFLSIKDYISEYKIFHEAVIGFFNLVHYNKDENPTILNKLFCPNIEDIKIPTIYEVKSLIKEKTQSQEQK